MVILGHALRLAVKVAQPISHSLHLDQLGKMTGIGVVTLLAVGLLIVVSFGAGIVARTGLGSRIIGSGEALRGVDLSTPGETTFAPAKT
jgi:hypothetical protein